jgi:hypothetical protein
MKDVDPKFEMATSNSMIQWLQFPSFGGLIEAVINEKNI